MHKVTLYFDGASKGNPGPAGIGGVVFDDSGKVHEVCRFIGVATNNQAEYNALLETLRLAAQLHAEQVEVFSDSELVVRQLTGEYQVKDPKLRPLYDEAMKLCSSFQKISFQHVPREKNKRADALANLAVSSAHSSEVEKWVEFSMLLAENSWIVQVLKKIGSGVDKGIEMKEPKKSVLIRVRQDGRAVSLEW